MLCNAKNFEVQQNFEYPNMYMVIVSSVLLVSSDIHLEKSWKKCSAHVFSYKSKKCKLSVRLYMNRIAVNHLWMCDYLPFIICASSTSSAVGNNAQCFFSTFTRRDV